MWFSVTIKTNFNGTKCTDVTPTVQIFGNSFSSLGPLSGLNLICDHGFGFYRAMLAQSAVMRLLSSVCLSVCLSVTIRYRVQIGLNSSKIISRPNSLGSMCWLTPNIGDLVQREHPQNWG